MKKLFIVIGACLAVSACADFDPDMDREAARREAERADYHQEFGCHFSDDHAAYRECLLNTYYAEKPKTFSASQDDKGRSVAIVRDETKQSYDKENDTYKTERVIVIETEEQLVPVPAPVVVQQVVQPAPAPAVAPEVIETPQPTKVTPKDTWWDTYQKGKKVESNKVQCPCPDPNEPCPQCVDK